MFTGNPFLRSGSAARRPNTTARRLDVETLEGRVVLNATIPDLELRSATTADSRSVIFTFNYEPGNPAPEVAEVDVAILRSSDPAYSHDDVEIARASLGLTAPGRVTIPLAEALAIDPARPFVVVIGDPEGTLEEEDTGDNADAFRIHTIGAVSHGFELLPGDSLWVDRMAASLPYDVAIPFHWDAYSSLPLPGMTVLAGRNLSRAIVEATSTLYSSPAFERGDVIALHAIGHSRGSVVISQAGLNLEALGARTPSLAALQAGPLMLSFLDPHPASNVYSPALYSAAPNFEGALATTLYTIFQSIARDPNVVVPASADWAEIYYQRSSYRDAVTPSERFFLVWGQNLENIEVHSTSTMVTQVNLTGVVPGHYLVHDWYQANVVPTLGGSITARALATTPSRWNLGQPLFAVSPDLSGPSLNSRLRDRLTS